MPWLFLRSDKKPSGDLPRWKSISDCDDMWTRLFFATAGVTGQSAVVQGRGRKHEKMCLSPSATVEWVNSFGLAGNVDVMWARGRYVYDPAFSRHKGAFKAFLGCGSAIDTIADRGFNLVLVDREDQVAHAKPRFPHAKIVVFPKPAIEDIFHPVPAVKLFDVVFIARRLDEMADFKGYSWLIERLPEGTRVLRVGPKDPWFAAASHLRVEWTGLIPPSEIPRRACTARVGVVCDDGRWDSGPRIVPEMLAMDIPIIMRKTVRASARYVTPQTGVLVGEDPYEFQAALNGLLRKPLHPLAYYMENLSMPVASKFLSDAIRNARCSS